MNKLLRWSLIILTSGLLITSVGLASFMVNVVTNEEAEVIDHTYNIVCHYFDENENKDLTFTLEDVEEDSTFDLPILGYSTKDFIGWSLSADRKSTFNTSVNNSVKMIKTNFPDVNISDKTLHLFAVAENIDENTVLLKINDQSTSSNGKTYYMKTAASVFNIFNIKYTYPSPFVYVIFDGDTKRYTVNETKDLSDKGGQTISVWVQKQI